MLKSNGTSYNVAGRNIGRERKQYIKSIQSILYKSRLILNGNAAKL